MNLREYALVAFTLLMQASVGIVLVLAVLPLLHASQPAAGGSWPSAGRIAPPLAVALSAAVLALLASLLHLGQPTLAWLALANFRASWLSREIVLAVVFVSTLATATLAQAGGRSGSIFFTAATAIAVLAGLALVFAMARLYMISGQPAWDRLATPIAFFASTVLLGLTVVVALAAPPLPGPSARPLGVAAVALLSLQVLLVPGLLASVPAEPAAALAPVSAGHLALWLAAARVVAAIAGAALLVALLRSGPGMPAPVRARYVALALVVTSEIFGRVLFYASSTRL